MDNGYATFTNVRIPRTDMLMGFAQVSSSGTYTKQDGAEKIAFGIMLDVRARICINSAYVLARALTISVRYSFVRLQGFVDNIGKNPTERSVMEYPTQQNVLMPLLAFAYALHFTGQDVKGSYSTYTSTNDVTLLPELHATSAGLKAYITTHVSEGMESCRKMCGGHGFLVNAGFADLYTSYLPFSTLEGTKEVLQQQMGRYLLKQYLIAISIRISTEKSELQSEGKSKKGSEKESKEVKKELNGTKKSGSMSPSTAYLLESLHTQEKESSIESITADFSILLKLAENGDSHSDLKSDLNSGMDMSDDEFDIIENMIFTACKIRAAWCVKIASQRVEKAMKKSMENSILLKKNNKNNNNSVNNSSSSRNRHVTFQDAADNNSSEDDSTYALDPLLTASVELCTAAEAHSELLILESFSQGIRKQMRNINENSNNNDDNENNFDSQNYDDYNIQYRSQNDDDDKKENKRTPSSSQTYLGTQEIKALRTMFVLLGINIMGTSSGQFLASGAIRVQDFSRIGERILFYIVLYV